MVYLGFVLFTYSVFVFILKKDKKKRMELDGCRGAEDLEGIGGEESDQNIFYENVFQLKIF